MTVTIKQITAGKFRRYHSMSFLKQLLYIPTTLRNLGDFFLVAVGFLQSLWLLSRIKPDVVFTKGGFVCLPLGMAAAVLKIPLVIHDSDAHAGLTNRILARWARTIATGAPLENYTYPAKITHYVGVPVGERFHPVSPRQQQHCKDELGLHDTKKPLVVVTGGGLGARNINRAVLAIAPQLLGGAAILHITGSAHYDEVLATAPEHIDYMFKPFIAAGMPTVFGAADIVVTRAGGSTLAELAAMAKPIIVVPNPLLTGGHQLKNAAVYERAKAAVVIDENELICNPSILKKAIQELLANPEKRRQQARALHQFAKPEAATDMAALIAEAATTGRKRPEFGVQ